MSRVTEWPNYKLTHIPEALKRKRTQDFLQASHIILSGNPPLPPTCPGLPPSQCGVLVPGNYHGLQTLGGHIPGENFTLRSWIEILMLKSQLSSD